MQQIKVESPNDHLMVTFQESDKDLPLDLPSSVIWIINQLDPANSLFKGENNEVHIYAVCTSPIQSSAENIIVWLFPFLHKATIVNEGNQESA